jgi:hypothetical protein
VSDVKTLEPIGYRAAMVEKMYQAQVMCPGCNNWVLTTNLEVFKDEDGKRAAEATDVTCTNSGCGALIGTVLFKDWPYSAPVKWREGALKPKAASA